MRILLLSAYDAQSHKYWREGMVAQFPEYDWTQLALPGHHFSWRIRSNSLQWALSERATLDQPYDLIIATSMVDFASLKGFVPNLANIPSPDSTEAEILDNLENHDISKTCPTVQNPGLLGLL